MCPHGFPSKGSCIDCMNDDGLGAPPKDAVAVEAVFTARYPGDCTECHLAVHEGQRIAKLSDGRYVHEGCAP